MHSLCRRPLLACTFLFSIVSVEASAQAPNVADGEEGSTTRLDTVVVSGRATSMPGGVTDTPQTSTATRQEIEQKQITRVEELGRSLEPGINFNRGTGAVNIRGLEGPRVLTTIDGIPVPYLNDTTRGSSGGVDLFDFSSLSGVDIVRGTDSSRGGSGALGGVLGLRTLEPEDLFRDGRNWGAYTGILYDGSDNSIRPSGAFALRQGRTSSLFQGSYAKGHELRNKGSSDIYGPLRTEPNPSDYDQHNLLFKLRHDLEGGHRIGVTAERFRRDRDTDDKRTQTLTGNYRPGDYMGLNEGARDRASLDYSYDGGEFLNSATASLYWIDQMRGTGNLGYRSTSVIGPYERWNTYEETTFGFIGSGEKMFETGTLNHRLTIGLDMAASISEQYTNGYDNCLIRYERACDNLHTNQADEPKVDSKRFGLFVDDEIGLGDSNFYLTPGGRFDWVDRSPKMTNAYAQNGAASGLPNSFSDSAFSPKFRISYRPSDALEVYGQWSMGFRVPTAGELYSSFGGPGTYLRRGNADLESETSQGFELGTRFGDEDLGFRASLFHNRYRNFIDATTAAVQDPATYPFGITEFNNLDKVRISGFEVAAHKRFVNGFYVAGTIAFARGENAEADTYLGSVPPIKGVASVGYSTEHWGTDLTFIGVRGVSDKSDATFKAPGYGIVDVSAWWQPEQIDGLTIRGGVYNLFDRTYYDAINVRSTSVTGITESYFSEPGRHFKLSLAKQF
jgi:hemoglobin/transferrin/lactoferrin receptor protein